MRCLKLAYADAFLLGPGAEPPVGLYWVPVSWSIALTAAGNRIAIPTPGSFPISEDYKWPVLPLVRHRGGYCTATARAALESGFSVYSTKGKCVRRVFGPLSRTAHRVFWVNRSAEHLVVDVIKRPRPEHEDHTRKHVPDGHLELVQLLFGRACPKCGSTDLKPRWGDGSGARCGYLGLCRWVGDALRANHVHITCQICHYEWLEAPLDAAQEAA